MFDLRHLPAVEDNVEQPEALSQTFLSRMDVCARSGYLYLRHRSGPTSHAMDRGTAFHAFAERLVHLLIDSDENSAPPEIAKDLLSAVIAENPTWQLPEPEMDALRIMAYHLAENL